MFWKEKNGKIDVKIEKTIIYASKDELVAKLNCFSSFQ